MSNKGSFQKQCKQGHEMTPENTYIAPKSGIRSCKKCRDITQRAYFLVEANRQKRRDKYSTPKSAPFRSNERARFRAIDAALKLEVLTFYGPEHRLCCSWPGCLIADIDMLSLDHTNNNGAEHRKTVKKVYRWVKKQGFPEGFQTLCGGHQFKKEIMHKRSKYE